jgi:hypothetical protein
MPLNFRRPAPGTVLGFLALSAALAGDAGGQSGKAIVQKARSPEVLYKAERMKESNLRSIGWPHKAVALTALVIAGLGSAGCGGGGSTTAPAPGSYVGTTSQGLPISFVVNSGAVSSVRFGWSASCADGQVHANTIVLAGTRVRDGAFSVGGTLETGGIAHVDGTFDGSKASGTLSRSGGTAFGTDCSATGVHWHAQVAPGSGSQGDAS